MKKYILLSVICMVFTGSAFSQQEDTYVTSGLEFINSWANVSQNGRDLVSPLRVVPVINIQGMLNKDISAKFGLFTGLAVRNVGYIVNNYLDPSNNIYYNKRFRSYNICIPVGIKLGNLEKAFLYGGWEFEWGFLYKEKTYSNGDKVDKITGWFSDRQNVFQQGFLVGIQFPYGANLKFKYYITEFNNQDYTDGSGVQPYKGLKSNIMYISLSFYLFKNLNYNATVE